MTPHMITIADFLTPNGLTGLAMISTLFAGMGSLIYVMFTK